MMKYVSNYLEAITGIGTYPMISFVVFFLFFMAVLWWVFTARRAHLDHMSALPLIDDNTNETLDHAR